MKKTILTGTLAAVVMTASAQVPAEYEVAPWYGFKDCAITYSFDDLCANQLPIAIPILDRYNVKASLNIVTDWVKPEQWAKVKEAAMNGHEIAGHTVSHPNMGELTAEKFEAEQRDSKRILEEKTGTEVITMVYPYCVAAHEEISEKYYISARVCDGRVEPHTPKNMMRISSKGVGTESDMNSAEAFNKWVDQGAKEKGWCTFLIHAIDGDGGYSPIKSTDLESHIKYVTGHPHKFWTATFAQVSKYIMERDAITIKETAQKKAISIETGCKAKSDITKLDQPITISRALPQNWKKASVKENGKKITSKTENGKVIFDVVPGNTYTLYK